MKMFTQQKTYSIIYRNNEGELKELSEVCPEGVSRKEFRDFVEQNYGKVLNMTASSSVMREYEVSEEIFEEIKRYSEGE